MWQAVPDPIVLECIAEQERMGWPDCVPKYAEIPTAGGQIVWQEWKYLTVGDCEQLVEHHTRKANKAIARFIKTGSRATSKTAAWNMIRARLYRIEYFVKLHGPEVDISEYDLPFPQKERE